MTQFHENLYALVSWPKGVSCNKTRSLGPVSESQLNVHLKCCPICNSFILWLSCMKLHTYLYGPKGVSYNKSRSLSQASGSRQIHFCPTAPELCTAAIHLCPPCNSFSIWLIVMKLYVHLYLDPKVCHVTKLGHKVMYLSHREISLWNCVCSVIVLFFDLVLWNFTHICIRTQRCAV